jgi:hypothetical protein
MLTTPFSAPYHYPPTIRMVQLKHPAPLPYTSLVQRNRAFTSTVCSRHAQNPGGVHWQAVKKDPVVSPSVPTFNSFHRQQVFHAWHYQQRNTSGNPCDREHRHNDNLANSLTKAVSLDVQRELSHLLQTIVLQRQRS